jgi:hypothetical protein
MKSLPLESCRKCPHHHSSPYPTDDSFERPEYWWCKHPDVEEVVEEDSVDERKRKFIKYEWNFSKLRYVAGYVEWRDNPDIPDFCPLSDIEAHDKK